MGTFSLPITSLKVQLTSESHPLPSTKKASGRLFPHEEFSDIITLGPKREPNCLCSGNTCTLRGERHRSVVVLCQVIAGSGGLRDDARVGEG